MAWFSRFFEGTNNSDSERRYSDSRYGGNAASLRAYDFSLWDSQSASLAEQGKRKHMNNDVFRIKEDEHLARALQESLKLEPSYQTRNVNFRNGFKICHVCNQPIFDSEFSLSGMDAYHKSCYMKNRHPQCDVCHHSIRVNAAGFMEYKVHSFWSQKYCLFHDHDGTPRCCSCDRMEQRGTQYVALNDGRKLCLECLDSAVMDTSECQPIYLDIQQFYEGLDMKMEQKIPILLVERQALNDAMDGQNNGHSHMPETRGLCLAEEQTVSTVLRQPRIVGNRVLNMRTEPYNLTRRAEVTAILVLYGLPRLLTGSILAHEMMHAWLRLNGYRNISLEAEEGICQVLAHMWLTSQISATSSRQAKRPPFEKKLAEFFKHQIESDMTLVYGNGFRAGNRAVLKYGLKKTLDHIQSTGRFPF